MNFDNDFNEVKIRHVIIIYLFTSVIVIGIAFYMLLRSDGEITGSSMNILSLLAGIFLASMLIYKIKPSKEKLKLLYNDFKDKMNIQEIIRIMIFLVCINTGGAKLCVDIVYLISPSLANAFINDYSLTVNSLFDYFICFILLVILTPIIDELTFRYVIFKRLSKKFNIYAGLIVSSIIYSSINICPEMLGTLALAIINCILYVKYENILMPMFLYFANNLLSMLISVPFGALKHKIITYTTYDIIINAIIGVILFAIGITFMFKFIIKNKVYLRESLLNSRSVKESINERYL